MSLLTCSIVSYMRFMPVVFIKRLLDYLTLVYQPHQSYTRLVASEEHRKQVRKLCFCAMNRYPPLTHFIKLLHLDACVCKCALDLQDDLLAKLSAGDLVAQYHAHCFASL